MKMNIRAWCPLTAHPAATPPRALKCWGCSEFLKLFLKPPTACKPSLAREAELHFSSGLVQILVHCLIPAWQGPEVAQQHLGGPLPPLRVSKPWLGSPRCQWHHCLALGALPACLSQLDLGAHPGMLSAGTEAGMCQQGWSCSSPGKIGCSGVGFAPQTAQLKAALCGFFPLWFPASSVCFYLVWI